MERRHPHIFGDAANSPGWEAIKATERAGKADDSALAGVATGLPALLRAEKLQKRAARVGFDWPDADGPGAKIDEETGRGRNRRRRPPMSRRKSATCCSRSSTGPATKGVDPEVALRAANGKFERRFRTMEAEAGNAFAALDLAAKEALWQAVKRRGG